MATRRRKRTPVRRKGAPRGSLAEAMMVGLFASYGFPPPMREVRIVPDRLWRFDFVWIGPRVAVELHGSTFSRGRHVTGLGFGRDREKMNCATAMGWKVFEYTTEDLRKRPDYIVEQVGRAIGYPVAAGR